MRNSGLWLSVWTLLNLHHRSCSADNRKGLSATTNRLLSLCPRVLLQTAQREGSGNLPAPNENQTCVPKSKSWSFGKAIRHALTYIDYSSCRVMSVQQTVLPEYNIWAAFCVANTFFLWKIKANTWNWLGKDFVVYPKSISYIISRIW